MRQLTIGSAVQVEVPATSANLGPGFDCFGLALDWREQVELTVLDQGFRIDVSGEGADAIPRDETHLIIRSALVGLADLGVTVTGLRLSCHNTIPHGRGLGSSSAAIVSGLIAAAGLAGQSPDPDWLLQHATAIEGHPDNVAAAIYGGFVLAYESRGTVSVARGRIDPSIGAAAFIPQHSIETKAARGLLPGPCRMWMPRPIPDAPRCWSMRWPEILSGCTTPPGTGCTRATGNRPCRGRTSW